MIYIIIFLIIAVFADTLIRDIIYKHRFQKDVNTLVELYEKTTKDISNKVKDDLALLEEAVSDRYDLIISLLGIGGDLNMEESDFDSAYLCTGNISDVTFGYITGKQKVTSDSFVDSVATLIKSGLSKESIPLSSGMIKDYHIVHIYLPDKEMNFTRDDKVLFDATRVGDKVFVRLNNDEIQTIAFKDAGDEN